MTVISERRYDDADDLESDVLLTDGLPLVEPYPSPIEDPQRHLPGSGPVALDYLVAPVDLPVAAGPDDVTYTLDYAYKWYDGRKYRYAIVVVDDH